MRERTRRPLATPVGLALVGGALWWAIGSLAFASGLGTLVLALGLLVAGALHWAARRRAEPPRPAVHSGWWRLVLLGGLLGVATAFGLGALGYGELAVPVACMIVGGCLIPAAGLLDRRGCLPLGAALMLLGACGALLALRSVGELYPRGLVGLGAGTLLFAAAAVDAGVHRELRAKIGSR